MIMEGRGEGGELDPSVLFCTKVQVVVLGGWSRDTPFSLTLRTSRLRVRDTRWLSVGHLLYNTPLLSSLSLLPPVSPIGTRPRLALNTTALLLLPSSRPLSSLIVVSLHVFSRPHPFLPPQPVNTE